MNVYVDFDRTLFDCDCFLDDLYSLISKYEIPKDIFRDCQIQCKKMGFNPEIILNKVREKYSFDNKLYQDIKNLINNASNYLYDDAILFLKYLNDNGYKVIILTKGNSEYQKEKILHALISDYYSDIMITMNHKGSLKIDYHNSVFIDDNPKEITSILKEKPKKIIRIKRLNTKYFDYTIDCEIETVNSLSEIIDNKLL